MRYLLAYLALSISALAQLSVTNSYSVLSPGATPTNGGTTTNTITVASGGLAVCAPTSTTQGIIGVTVGNPGSSGIPVIADSGIIPVRFDGTPVASHWVQVSATTCGFAHDLGASVAAATTAVVGIVASPATAVTVNGVTAYNVIWINSAPLLPSAIVAAPTSGEPVSTTTTIKVNGISAPVYLAKTQAQTTEFAPVGTVGEAQFVNFDFTGQIPVSVTQSAVTITSAVVKTIINNVPTKVPFTVSGGNTVNFTVVNPAQYYVEINGDWANAVYVFANPLQSGVPSPTGAGVQQVTPGSYSSIALTGSNKTLYFGPGQYFLTGTTPITLSSNQTIYLADGAFLYCGHGVDNECILASGNNVSLLGRGVIDQSEHAGNAAIAAYANNGTVATLTAVNQYQPGDTGVISGVNTSGFTFLNGVTFTVATASTSSFTFAYASTVTSTTTIDGTAKPSTTSKPFKATGTGITVDGITIRDASNWSLWLFECPSAIVNNYKAFGWRLNSDGLDVDGSNATVTNSSLRTYDDLLTYKTNNTDGTTITSGSASNLLLFRQKAHAITFGTETNYQLSGVSVNGAYIVRDQDFNPDPLISIYANGVGPIENNSVSNVQADEVQLEGLMVGMGVASTVSTNSFNNITMPQPSSSSVAVTGFGGSNLVTGTSFNSVVLGSTPLQLSSVTQTYATGTGVSPTASGNVTGTTNQIVVTGPVVSLDPAIIQPGTVTANYAVTNNDTSSESVYPGAMNVNFTATTPAQTLAITGVTLVSGQTYLFMATNTLVAGRVVYFPVSETNFPNFTGGATALNGQTVTVLSSGLSGTQFEAVITGTVTSSSSISPPATGYTPAQAVLPGMRVVSTGPGYTSLCPAEYYQGTLFGASFCIEAAPLGVGGPDASAIFGSSYTIDPFVGSNASQFFAYCLNSYTRCWGTNPSAQIISVHTAAIGTIGQNTITLSSLPGYGTIYPTMGIWNSTGITDGTQVQSISGLTVTLTANNIGAVSGQVNFAPMHANINASELDMHAEAPASFGNAYLGALIGLSIASNLPTGGTWNATGVRMPAIFCKTADNTPCYYKQGFSTDRADFSPSTGTILNFGAAGAATCLLAGVPQNPCVSGDTVTNFGSATLEADYLNYYDIVTQAPVDVRFQRLIGVPSSTYAANPTSFTMRYSLVGNADVTGAIPIYEYQANGVGASEFKIDDGTGGSATITAAPTSLLELNGNANVSTAGIVTGTGFATGSAGVTGAVVFGSVGGGTVSLQPSTAIATTNTLLFPNSALTSDTIATVGVANTFTAAQTFTGITLGATNAITWNGLTKARVPGDGKIEFTDNAGDGAFIRAMFGGTTAASPAFCFSGTSIQVCGADGTAVGSFTSPSLSTADLAFGSKTTYSPSACETGFGATSVNTSGFTTGTGLNCLPANSVIDAVVYRITADITTAASFTVGQTGSTTQFCSTQSTLTSGTTGICIPPAYAVQSTSAGVAVTFNATPGAGALRLIVYYHTFTPPTS